LTDISCFSNAAVEAGNDSLSSYTQARGAIMDAFKEHAGLFVQEEEDESLPCELFELP
jgi:hypothetical protein